MSGVGTSGTLIGVASHFKDQGSKCRYAVGQLWVRDPWHVALQTGEVACAKWCVGKIDMCCLLLA